MRTLFRDLPGFPFVTRIETRRTPGRHSAATQWRLDDNKQWTAATHPILDAFFHARLFLEMASRYRSREKPPQLLPSGYAALLYLYGLR